MMDAKLTPEQAIEILRQEFVDYSPVSKFVKPISRIRAHGIADLIESLATDADAITGVKLIAAERQRQIEKEGWTPEHDDQHENGELALAAACYAIPIKWRVRAHYLSELWPWALKWWKPTPDNRIRELQKAGALIAAEIDRLRAGKGGE